MDYSRTHSVRRLLELIYKLTGSGDVRGVLEKFSVELGSLEDSYITSRYVARSYSPGEAERLRRTVEEVMRIVGGVVGS